LLLEGGDLAPAEMVRTFNCGIGMVTIVAEEDAGTVLSELEEAGETAHRIGELIAGRRGCTVRGSSGWGSEQDWTVTHHG
jgi:phosphoribosylformylglycinamidine cyclo-ligase